MIEEQRPNELRRFLKERRARVRPADVGLPAGGRRRVTGLRREEVAALAGIGVSWYTDLESGNAAGVSLATLTAVARALRLSDYEREYLLAIAGHPHQARQPALDRLMSATLSAIAFPAYVIGPAWDIVACNDAFRRVWAIDRVPPFNAVVEMFLEPAARRMHGDRFVENIRPVIAMVRSGLGRRPHLQPLIELRDRFLADPILSGIWNDYEIASPLSSNACTIDSAIGVFRYETLTLPNSDVQGIVVQVPDDASAERVMNDADRRDVLRPHPASGVLARRRERYEDRADRDLRCGEPDVERLH